MKIARLKRHIKTLFDRFVSDDVSASGAQLAYSFLLSFFPFLIFLITLIGYSGLKSEQVFLLLQDALKDTLPRNTYDLVNNIVAEVVNYKRGSLLSLSILITIWVASSGISALIKAPALLR